MERYLVNYLKEHATDEVVKKYVGFFQNALDLFIYNYGEHTSELYYKLPYSWEQRSLKQLLKLPLKQLLKRNIVIELQTINALYGKIKTTPGTKNILLGWAGFPDISQLANLGYNALSFIFSPYGRKQIIGDKESLMLRRRIQGSVCNGKFIDIYNKDLFYRLEKLQPKILNSFIKHDIRALFLYSD
ncbi:hypothetical protein SAMD00024442_25_21 [Candidatus Symbiothrix dinenymphae]|nr:hypothetical protein SAMD00024442_25_21 [Candidatus Symbiothrix dinenymphae]